MVSTHGMLYKKKEIRIGSLYGYTGGNFGGIVYDSAGICPSILTMQGGGRQPHLIEVRCVDSKDTRTYAKE